MATITDLREHRLSELSDAAQRERIVAEALEALVEVIHAAPVPVAHYGPIWRHVEARLAADAREARRRSLRALDHVADVQIAIDARARWSG